MSETNRDIETKADASKEQEKSAAVLNVPLLALSAGLSIVVVLGALFGLPSAFLAAAALTLFLVIFLVYRALVALESDDEALDLEEAFHLAVPLRAEEQKRALLRTLKDLDFELASGKISQKDYDDVAVGVREEAKKMIVLVDEALLERKRKAEELFETFAKVGEDSPKKADTPPIATEKKAKKNRSEKAS